MSFSADVRDAAKRFPQHVTAFEELFRRHHISSVTDAWRALGQQQFRNEVAELGEQIMRKDGGKITLPILLAIIGAALGGVGIAAMGSAIGVPLALVGTIAGLILGNEADSEGITSTFIRKMKAFVNG